MKTLQTRIQRTGCYSDLERAVPHLYRVDSSGAVTEAILDVSLSVPGGFCQTYFDVTVRCPHSVRNEQGNRAAAQKVAVAASDGELEKVTRYGRSVVPVAMETYGRMGFRSQL